MGGGDDINITIMPSDDIKFVLRVPKEVYEVEKKRAEEAGKSLNKWLLEKITEGENGSGKVVGVGESSSVSDVRGRVLDDSGEQGESGDSGAGAVQRPRDGASADRGTVDGGVQQDTERPGVCERKHVTPHGKGCGCGQCKPTLTATEFGMLSDEGKRRAVQEGRF